MFIPLAVMIVKHFEDLNSTKALTFYCGSCTQVILLFQHMYFSNNLCCLICMQCKNADSYNMMTCYKVASYNGTHCLCILLYLPVPVLIPFIYDQ